MLKESVISNVKSEKNFSVTNERLRVYLGATKQVLCHEADSKLGKVDIGS